MARPVRIASGSNTVSATGAGSCTVTATKAADANYGAATSAPLTITVDQAAQATVYVAAASNPFTYGTTTTLTGSGGSGTGAFSYAVASAGTAGCSITGGNTLGATSGGTCSVTATRAADTNYTAATSSPLTITVGQASQSISFTQPEGIIFAPNATVVLKASASSELPVTFTSLTSSVCSVNSATATVTFLTAGTCSIKVSQGGNAAYAAAPDVTISFGAAAPPIITATATVTPYKYYQAGQTLNFAITLTNSGGTPITGIKVAEPRLQGITCAGTTLAAGAKLGCQGTTTTTAADLTAGKITISPQVTYTYGGAAP
jgi:hypothetical protein